MTIDDYIAAHTDPEPPYLQRLYHACNVHLQGGHMACGHVEGRVLRMLVKMIRPRNILEVGTLGGYSAISMAEGLEEGGRVWTFDINDELEDFTRPWIEGSPVAERIRYIVGDAITEAPRLGIVFDMVFLDGDKRTYTEAYEMALCLTRRGGYIVADNTLWYGHVTETPRAADRQTQGISRFNELVAADPRVERVMLPLRDGLTIIRVC